MTLEEAQAVADIASWADDGCKQCVEEMRIALQDKFRGFNWAIIEGTGPSFVMGRRIMVTAQKDHADTNPS